MRLLTLLVVLLGTLTSQSTFAQVLRVLTYNIHHAEGRDGVWNVQRIADVIKSINPDVVALQEIDQATTRSGSTVYQLDSLASLTGMKGYFGRTIDYQGGQYGNGVLVRSDINVGTVTNHPLPSPNGGEARRVMELELSLDIAGRLQSFNFFATHLDASNTANRIAQVNAINALVEISDTPSILAGDFNFRRTSAEYALIDNEWLDSTISNAVASQIDYVMYRNADQWEVVTRGVFVVNQVTNVASDHYPFVAVLELQPAEVPEPTFSVITATALTGLCRRLRRKCR
jgi:endonuclease/exonuclease/phosphatase family metal-dependent hydrolase